ncbi:MAG: chemotaxis protein CheW, partial [Mariprofundaceae bacterium]|nr:chemotaxis protein CheW [Mariprofundaceae bacterium]
GLIRRLNAAERLMGEGGVALDSCEDEAVAEAATPAEAQGAASPAEEAVSPAVTPATSDKDWLTDFETIKQALTGAGMSTPQSVLQAGFNGLKAIEGIPAPQALKLLGVAKKLAVAVELPAADELPVANEQLIKAAEQPEVQSAKPLQGVAEAESPGSGKAEVKAVEAPAVKQPSPSGQQQLAQAGGEAPGRAAETIRVDVAVLDALMNQVGELVLSRNRLLQLVSGAGGGMRHTVQSDAVAGILKSLVPLSRDINHITESLQDRLLKTRMQPISTIWGTVPRIVRDMGRQLNKKINVLMEGQETELDRTILAALKDPLTHIIRNSCDHGIELPSERLETGKSDSGTLTLCAAQEAGSILIVIRDDGAGIDASRVKNKAVEMGVLTPDAAEAMSDSAALQLIFHAGLSTAKKVSNISGRGVGMDVVKNAIEKAGGSVEIQSTPGKGTTLRIRIPLTMAIISAMLVQTAGQMFAVPQMSVQELLATPGGSEHWCGVAGQRFFRLRGQLLPVVRLTDSLGMQVEKHEKGSIVVVHAGNRRIGLLVDEIIGSEELVVKPLGMHFRDVPVFGGCSILGDGSVVPILECNGVVQSLKLSAEAELAQEEADRDEHKAANEEMQHTLVFRGLNHLYAIPMMLVERLESLPPGRIEQSGGREVLQYRGDVIPVLRWNHIIGGEALQSEEDCCLIISDNGKRMCLQVDQVEDILQTPLRIEMKSKEKLFLGTTVIHEQSTEVIDVFELLRMADPEWFSSTGNAHEEGRRTILFAEDAPFFRTMLIPVLESMAYEVWYARDGQEACEILEHQVPDVVLTDLEMPRMSGYELAEWVSSQESLADVPVIAISSSPPEDNDSARRKHFHTVLSKMDRQGLADCLGQLHATGQGSESVSPVFERPVLVGGRPQ